MAQHTKYFKQLENNLSLSIGELKPLIIGTHKKARLRINRLKGADHLKSIYPNMEIVLSYDPEDFSILFEWRDDTDGEEWHTQRVELVEEPSNLGRGSVYYFAVNWRKCRKLWLIGDEWRPRHAFKSIYWQQRLSRSQRTICIGRDPYKKHGKHTYRGQLTPYGRKYAKYRIKQRKRLQEQLRIARKSALL